MLKLDICGSKSESNRALILQSQISTISISNISSSDDSILMQSALNDLMNGKKSIYCGHAGTVIRFMVARSVFEPDFDGVITGSKRLLSRPIAPLIDALKPFAKSIIQKADGIHIKSHSTFDAHPVFTIDATLSSQFISAICLCSPSFSNGCTVKLLGQISSRPYIQMTLDFLKQQGFENTFGDQEIHIKSKTNSAKHIAIEPDWSSLSYWFSFAAIARQNIALSNFQKESLQADARIVEFAHHFGLEFIFSDTGLSILANGTPTKQQFVADFDDCPDIAPTFMALCAAMHIPCKLTGLHSLKVKECDRILVMQKNLKLLGYTSNVTDSSFEISDYKTDLDYTKTIVIPTDLDHRMAMCMAPFKLLYPNISFDDPTVVNKSYPNFWIDLKKAKNYIKH